MGDSFSIEICYRLSHLETLPSIERGSENGLFLESLKNDCDIIGSPSEIAWRLFDNLENYYANRNQCR